MNNIKLTCIRLIANAYLYGKEKNKECHAYRFDSSFLTSREITTVEQLNELQLELNKLGWCFNIINFNDYIIQEKTWIGEMTKLGFGRVQEIKDDELMCEYIQSLNDQITNRVYDALARMIKDKHQYPKPTVEKHVEEIAGSYKRSTIRVYNSYVDGSAQINTHKDIKIKTEELCTMIYGDYFSENKIVFSGNIPKKWLDTIVDTVEKEIA
jgi:hypothetical protein